MSKSYWAVWKFYTKKRRPWDIHVSTLIMADFFLKNLFKIKELRRTRKIYWFYQSFHLWSSERCVIENESSTQTRLLTRILNCKTETSSDVPRWKFLIKNKSPPLFLPPDTKWRRAIYYGELKRLRATHSRSKQHDLRSRLMIFWMPVLGILRTDPISTAEDILVFVEIQRCQGGAGRAGENWTLSPPPPPQIFSIVFEFTFKGFLLYLRHLLFTMHPS